MTLEVTLYLLFTLFTGTIVSLNTINERIQLPQYLFVGFISGVLFPALLMYGLTICNVFSKYNFFVTYVVILTLLTCFSAKSGKMTLLYKKIIGYNYYSNLPYIIFHLTVTICFFAYYDKPSEWIVSFGMDASNYIIQAAYQLTHSSLYFEDFQGDKYSQFFADVVYKINSTTSHRPTFPFPPLNKLFLTVAMLFDLHLAYYVHILFAGMVYWSFCILSRRFFENIFIKVLTPVIAISLPMFVLYSTVPMSEMLMLATVSSTLALAYIGHETKNSRVFGLAGFFFGSIFAIRMESIIYYVPMITYGVVCYAKLTEKRDNNTFKYMLLMAALSSMIFWYPAIGSGEHYYSRQLGGMFVVQNYLLPVIMFFVLVVCYCESAKRFVIENTRWLLSREVNLYTGMCVMILMLVVTYLRYFERLFPEKVVTSIMQLGKSGQTIFKVGFINDFNVYASPFLLFTGILGIGLIVATRQYKKYSIIAVFICASLITLVNPHHSDSHYWLVRRYLICVFPMLVFTSSSLIDYVLLRFTNQRFVRIIVLCLWVGMSGYWIVKNNSILHTHGLRHYVGMTEKFQKHSKMYDPLTSILIVDGTVRHADAYMLAMKYIFNIESLAPMLGTITNSELVSFYDNMTAMDKEIFFCALRGKQLERIKAIFDTESVYFGELPSIGDSNVIKILGR